MRRNEKLLCKFSKECQGQTGTVGWEIGIDNMANISKIVKYNLEDEVKQLKDMKYKHDEIAEILRANHPKIVQLQNLSGMSVGRYFKSLERVSIEKSIDEEGRDPVKDFITEYRVKMEKLVDETETLYKKCYALIDDAKTSHQFSDKIKALELSLKAAEQQRRNRVSLVQYGERKTENITKINMKKEYHIKNLLLNFSKVLCPKCREKVSKEMESYMER